MNRHQCDYGGSNPVGCFFLLVIFSWSFLMFVLTRDPKVAEQNAPIDSCIDGIVMSFDGYEWHPVYIRKTKRTIKCSPTGEIGKRGDR